MAASLFPCSSSSNCSTSLIFAAVAFRLAKTNAAVGIATGRTRVDRTRPTGEGVDRAAALAHSASRGQVLADTTTSELARGRYEFQIVVAPLRLTGCTASPVQPIDISLIGAARTTDARPLAQAPACDAGCAPAWLRRR